MARIACAWIPRFELALLARREGPGLWRRPAVVVDPSAAPAVVLEATPIAERSGIRRGSTLAEAQARCGRLTVHPTSPGERAAGEREVLAVLARLAPQLASDGRGAFFLGLAGMGRLAADERGFAARVEAALRSLRLPGSVGVAGHPFAAWIAAGRGMGPVAPGRDAALLASVPLAALDLDERARDLLALLGVATAGQVARLPRGALGRRLGPAGERLERLCRGERLPPETLPTAALVPRPPHAAQLDLESPVDTLEPLLFLVKGLLDGLLAEVAATRQALAELTIEVELEDAGRSRVARRVAPAEPTLEVRPLADMTRLWLERAPLAAPVRAVRLVASRVAPAASRQLRLLAQREDAGEAAFARALARLAAAFGPEAVVRPALASRFLPEGRVAWVPVRQGGVRAAGGPAGAPRSRALRRARGSTGTPDAASGGARGRGAAGDRAAGGDRSQSAGPAPKVPWALRLLAAPEPVELAGGERGAPRLLLRRGEPPRRVLRVETVQRRSGEWWAAPFDRSYAWVVCERGERFWLFHDHLVGGLFLHALAD